MEAEQSINRKQHDEREYHTRQDAPARDDPSIIIRVIIGKHEHPNALSYDRQTIQGNAAEQSNEAMIVLAADAVVQVLAVMVELLRAAIAAVAVVAGFVHVDAAFYADLQLVISHAWLLYAEQQVVSWIGAGEIEVVCEGEGQEDVGRCEEDPEYGGVLACDG